MGDITGLYMTDEEGTLTTVEVQAKFVNGKPDKIECKYVMRRCTRARGGARGADRGGPGAEPPAR